ncbi:unnamed protein product [Peniophora sp. CBMAI 1063]|nr:unnamed protein product [Peniophora sp. CBMAI 1063]
MTARSPIVKFLNDVALLNEGYFDTYDDSHLSRTHDAFGNRTRDRRMGPGDLLQVKDDQAELWYIILDHTLYELEAGNRIVRKAFGPIWWSKRQLMLAIRQGQVSNADVLSAQLADMEDDRWILAANHAEYIDTDRQVNTGVTTEEMLSGRLGHFELEAFLLIEDIEGTDPNDSQRPREFIMVTRSDLHRWLSE